MFRKKSGQTTVELALAVLLLFGLLFAIIDLGVLFFVNLTMQHAVRAGTRYAVTGQSDLDPNGGTDRRAALIQAIKDSSYGFYDKNLHNPKDPTVKVITPISGAFTNYTGGTLQTGTPGQPNDIIVVSLTYTWPLMTPVLKPFFPSGLYTFTVKSTMRNEPFPVSGGS
jgi:Flp pilus assembly protein TadG